MLAANRDEFIESLRERGVGTSVHFIPIPKHPYYSQRPGLSASYCPNALALYPRILSLPLYPSLSADELDHIVASVKAIIHKAKRQRAFAATY
jgi:dTDP-4-amino-4,6-dideoxygalactose transaminase